MGWGRYKVGFDSVGLISFALKKHGNYENMLIFVLSEVTQVCYRIL